MLLLPVLLISVASANHGLGMILHNRPSIQERASRPPKSAVDSPNKPEVPPPSTSSSITLADIAEFERHYSSGQPKNAVAALAVARYGLEELPLDPRTNYDEYFEPFSNEITMLGTAPDQKYSGRCWIFAGLSMLREPLMKRYPTSTNNNHLFAYLCFLLLFNVDTICNPLSSLQPLSIFGTSWRKQTPSWRASLKRPC